MLGDCRVFVRGQPYGAVTPVSPFDSLACAGRYHSEMPPCADGFGRGRHDITNGSEKARVRMLPSVGALPPVQALDWALTGIADAYGEPTAKFVTTQIEYKRSEVTTASMAEPRE